MMRQKVFEKQVLNKLIYLEKGINGMKKDLDVIKNRAFNSSRLSEDDKRAIDEALKEERERKLLSKDKAFS